ncbi:MAG: hypothetical protein C4320_07350, partial [Armatimonadota bacterium]
NIQNVEETPRASDYVNLVGRIVTGGGISGRVSAVKVTEEGVVLSVSNGTSRSDLLLGEVTSIGA